MRLKRRLCALIGGLALVSSLGLSTGETAALASPATKVAGLPAATTYDLTLITGDRIHLQKLPGDRQAATIEPGPGREAVDFHQTEIDGQLYVFPVDVLPYLAAGRVERDLFNVTLLLSEGLADAERKNVPLIVEYGKGARTMAVPESATPDRTLESIDARAVHVQKDRTDEFWKALTGPGRKMTGGVASIHLDKKVRASLDRSVPQIGAPEAWKAGYDGKGVKVAVLDTGVDRTHADLTAAVSGTKNFTDSPTDDDRFGHGTHVSSIVAGRGVADTGKKGVAPGTELIVGKVLNDDGEGYESWILDGMEWAAGSGAKVVNLSLGGGPTDGTDRMSEGLNNLTEQTGTLFVVSAGNDGEKGDFTVGTPGAADAALTVGAVDRDETLAPFSSKGPRLGDFAVKPDITAPGVGISAARAGSSGSPYVAYSGTSMAAPHVAGAAAILAQRHPDWKAPQLKDALASTAVRRDGSTPFQQGGGRVDVERAVSQQIIGTGTLSLGRFAADETQAVTREVTYTNAGSDPVTLKLSLRLDGTGEGVRLRQDTVDVPAGGTAAIQLDVDPAKLARGRFSGYLEATASGVSVHTSLGLVKEVPRHRLTLSAKGRDGQGAFTNPIAVFGEDSRFDYLGYLNAGETVTIEVGEGTYDVYGAIEEKQDTYDELFVVQNPALEVKGDTSFVFDARKANRVEITTPEASARQEGIVSLHSSRVFELPSGATRRISHFRMDFDYLRNIYAAPTSPVENGSFEFGTRWQLVEPRLTVGAGGSTAIEPYFLPKSPLLEGSRRLPLVHVGAGKPEDFAGKDVRGKVVLVTARDANRNEYVQRAAEGGAALVLIAVPSTYRPWTKWGPTGARDPIMGALISHREGQRLASLFAAGGLTVSLRGTPSSPYLYDVQQLSHGRIPERIVHRASTRNTAAVRSTYYESGGLDWQKEQRFAWRPWQDTALNQYQRVIRTPSVRTEYVSSGDTLWQHRVKHYYSWDSLNPVAGGMLDLPRTYRNGQQVKESWFGPVSRPAIPTGLDAPTSTRDGDTLRIRVPEWADGQAGHFGYYERDLGGAADKGSASLYRNGVKLADAGSARVDFDAGSGDPSTYRLDLNVERKSADWEFADRTQTSWTFGSARTTSPTPLPLLQLDYNLRTDLHKRVYAGTPFVFGVGARHQAGLRSPDIRRMTVRVSYDDGSTWKSARAVRIGRANFLAVVDHPRVDTGHVTLSVRAEDSKGNAVEQTIHRAYGLK